MTCTFVDVHGPWLLAGCSRPGLRAQLHVPLLPERFLRRKRFAASSYLFVLRAMFSLSM
jgi:hypothetical protein